MFPKMAPKTLQMLLIAAALAYLLLPYDLIPDFFGLPGRLDDVLMMAWLAWLYQTRGSEWLSSGAGTKQRGTSGKGQARAKGQGAGGARASAGESGEDPYVVLGVRAGASADEVQRAYRERMQEYHPDKVAHLGKALQELALKKTHEIQRAYRQLSG
ncbi:MAG: DUF1232 domain-containing protein [Myxococcota bacterium]